VGYLVRFFYGDWFVEWQPSDGGEFFLVFTVFIFFLLLPCLSWILLYGFVIIPNEPYVKFCKDTDNGSPRGVGHHVRAFLSNETETWECPPKPGSTWVKQYMHRNDPSAAFFSRRGEKDWQCNETYCTADELASPESCFEATALNGYMNLAGVTQLRTCDNWSADYPLCCVNADYDGTYVQCEYCIPDKTILWVISTLAGIPTFIPCFFLLGSLVEMLVDSSNVWGHEVEKAKKEAEEKAKKEAEAAEHGV